MKVSLKIATNDFWGVIVQCDYEVLNRKPNIVMGDKEESTCIIIDIVCPGNVRVVHKGHSTVHRITLDADAMDK